MIKPHVVGLYVYADGGMLLNSGIYGAGGSGMAEMKGKSAFDLAEVGGGDEMKGKNAFDFAEVGGMAEMKGKSAFVLAEVGGMAEMKGYKPVLSAC